MKQALTIAGSDSGGGAGIQADIKTIEANGVFAISVITAVTAQNTVEVRDAVDLPLDIIRCQMDAVFDDFDIAAAKTGMLSSTGVIETVCDVLVRRAFTQLVVDPVMISKSGYRLLKDEAIDCIKSRLLPLALVATPNLHEASLLAGFPIRSNEEMREAAEAIGGMGPRNVVVKGGHSAWSRGVDVFFDGRECRQLDPLAVYDRSVHGTGCTFSAAITARLALGEPLLEAVRKAKRYTTQVIAHQLEIGHGYGPGHHFYFISPEDAAKD
jgi:hydroxymethylpyrimidine/phosphomethylpyrimidine kinase